MQVHEDWLAKKSAEIEAKLMQKEKASREQRQLERRSNSADHPIERIDVD